VCVKAPFHADTLSVLQVSSIQDRCLLRVSMSDFRVGHRSRLSVRSSRRGLCSSVSSLDTPPKEYRAVGQFMQTDFEATWPFHAIAEAPNKIIARDGMTMSI
jgi:hypothetical protein